MAIKTVNELELKEVVGGVASAGTSNAKVPCVVPNSSHAASAGVVAAAGATDHAIEILGLDRCQDCES